MKTSAKIQVELILFPRAENGAEFRADDTGRFGILSRGGALLRLKVIEVSAQFEDSFKQGRPASDDLSIEVNAGLENVVLADGRMALPALGLPEVDAGRLECDLIRPKKIFFLAALRSVFWHGHDINSTRSDKAMKTTVLCLQTQAKRSKHEQRYLGRPHAHLLHILARVTIKGD
jgi:hypothetical protein